MDRFLVTPDWLADHAAEVVVLDCSWSIPEAGRNPRAEFEAGHLPGARFLDLDAISDADSPYVNMLPDAAQFARVVGDLGVGADTQVVLYDSGYVSARVWWMFRHFGHGAVAILDGGLSRWQAEGRPLETGPAPAPLPAAFPLRGEAADVADWHAVHQALEDGSALVLDARTRERFTGELPSGYPGVAGGHMHGAVNLPWGGLKPEGGFLPVDAARTLMAQAGVDDRPVIATCGSGVTAAILLFQLARMGRSDVRLYDGSWHEWGQRDDLPKESL